MLKQRILDRRWIEQNLPTHYVPFTDVQALQREYLQSIEITREFIPDADADGDSEKQTAVLTIRFLSRP
jgi:hypothetical protein